MNNNYGYEDISLMWTFVPVCGFIALAAFYSIALHFKSRSTKNLTHKD